MKKSVGKVTIFLIFLLCVPLAYSQVTRIVVGKLQSEATISPLGEASFGITVTNNRPQDDVFVLELSDVAWSLRTKDAPDYTTGIALGGYETRNTSIFIKPSHDIAAGTYFVELRIRSADTGKYANEVFAIKIDPKVVDYSVTIQAEILEPTSIDPQKTNSVKVLVKNPHPVYLTSISVEASSKFLNKKTVVDIPPKSEKVLDFSLNIDASTPKQEDVLNVVVKQGDKEIATAQKTLYIKEFRLPYEVKTETTKKFLHTIYIITFTNTEGAQKTQDASIPNLKTYAILVTKPQAKTDVFDNKEYLVWTGVSLNPNETYQVKIVEDYRQLTGFAIAILLLIILYYQLRSPIIVKKKAYAIHKKDTGNNEIKVMLYIHNRSNKTIEKVRVLDRLPMIHKVEEDFGAGTPEPKYRRHGTEGVILDWDIVLAPKEERIFSYKIKSALPIVGEFTLKPCIVQYGTKNRRTSTGPYRLMID